MHRQTLCRLALLLLLLLPAAGVFACAGDPPPPTATPAPTPTPDPLGADAQTFENPTAGFTLRYPADWVSEDYFGMLGLIASNPEVLAGALENADFTDGAYVVAVVGAPGDPSIPTLDQLLTDETITMVEGPSAVTIGGVSGQRVLAASSDPASPLSVLAISAERDGWRYLFGGVMPSARQADYLPTLEAIIMSITFSAPADLTPPDVEAPPATGSVLTTGAPLSVTLSAPTGFPVTLAAGTTYLLAGGSPADLLLTLYQSDGDGAAVLARANNNPSGEPELLFYTPAADGEYLLGVRQFDEAAAPAPLLLSAQSVTPSRTPVTFTVAAGDLPVLSAVADDGSDIVLSIEPADGRRMATITVDNQFDQPELYLWRDAPAGSYRASVRGFESEVAGYALTVTTLDPRAGAFRPADAQPGMLFGETSDGGTLPPNALLRTQDAVAVSYSTEVTAQTIYLLLAVGGGDADIVLELLDAEQALAARVDQAGPNQPELIVWQAAASEAAGVIAGDLFGRPHTQTVGLFALTPEPLAQTLPVSVTAEQVPVVVLLPDEVTDVVLTVQDAAGTSIATIDRTAAGGPEVFAFVGLPEGAYTVGYTFFAGNTPPEVAQVVLERGALP